MAKINKMLQVVVDVSVLNKQARKSPIPTLQIEALGKTLTQQEWEKFYKRLLIPKLQRSATHTLDGKLTFFGEYGLEAALILQHKFPGRFHFVLNCSTRESMSHSYYLSQELGLNVLELRYTDEKNEYVNINDPEEMDLILQEAIFDFGLPDIRAASRQRSMP